MARQSNTPIPFAQTTRVDTVTRMSSGRAGVVVPMTYIPILRGDSASGSVGIDFDLAEMPKPLRNAVTVNAQAWWVPKAHYPQFAGYDEFLASYHGEKIKSLGAADRDPPPFFHTISGAALTTAINSDLFKTLGIHVPPGMPINAEMIDAFVLAYNFRLAAHSSKLQRRKYAQEDIAEATALPRAFWPSYRFSRVVPDYDRALVVGALDLDIVAGQVPVDLDAWTSAMRTKAGGTISSGSWPLAIKRDDPKNTGKLFNGAGDVEMEIGFATTIFGDLAGQRLISSLADIDKARQHQHFARMHAAYAGADPTGFANADAVVADLMQGFAVPHDYNTRPYLLDSQRVGFGMVQRHATDAANLDQSVSQGTARIALSLNLPRTETGGMIVVIAEVLPERLDERQSDEHLIMVDPADLPDALRDVLRVEPVDPVLNRRLDAKHVAPDGLYGYEPMNAKWQRESTMLGGSFYQQTPGAPWTEARSALWLPEIVNPAFTNEHYLAPSPFPHDVFADAQAPAFEFVCRHALTIRGNTQIGDVLVENNDDFEAVANMTEE